MNSLLDNAALEKSPIVANSLMNRERGCVGGNSYAKELALNPIEFLTQKLQAQAQVAWLDICCGSGKALVQAATQFQAVTTRVQITGIDLVPMFLADKENLQQLQLQAASILTWEPEQMFDLITCVHGLHYIGDKLLVLQKAASWLLADGLFIGHLDMNNLRGADGSVVGKQVLKSLRKAGFQYNSRKRLLSLKGHKQVTLNYTYLGADDQAGPNYTGQAAVHSYYAQSPHA